MANFNNYKNPKNTCGNYVSISPGASTPIVPCLPPCACTINNDDAQRVPINHLSVNATPSIAIRH